MIYDYCVLGNCVKILTVSDTVMAPLESAANLRRRYSDVDLVISCGDMPSAYLDFITTILGKPLLYVRGNHDERYEEIPPGGVNLHNRIYDYEGLTFIGLEGSMRYNKGTIQYTQSQMRKLVFGLIARQKLRQLQSGRSIDVFVAHSPPKDIHDAEDLPHQGFKAFLTLMQYVKPRYMFHGHVHTWDRRRQVVTQYGETTIININPYRVVEVEPAVD